MTESVSMGEFVKTKLHNMATWAQNEIGKENLQIDLPKFVQVLSHVEVTLMAQEMQAVSVQIAHRDWKGLFSALQAEFKMPEMLSVFRAIQEREAMHEKFWRYLELFRDVGRSEKSDA